MAAYPDPDIILKYLKVRWYNENISLNSSSSPITYWTSLPKHVLALRLLVPYRWFVQPCLVIGVWEIISFQF